MVKIKVSVCITHVFQPVICVNIVDQLFVGPQLVVRSGEVVLGAFHLHDLVVGIEALDRGEGEPLQVVQNVFLEVFVENPETAVIFAPVAPCPVTILNLDKSI